MHQILKDVLGEAVEDLETVTDVYCGEWIAAASLERALGASAVAVNTNLRIQKLLKIIGKNKWAPPPMRSNRKYSFDAVGVANDGTFALIDVIKRTNKYTYSPRPYYNLNSVLWVILHTNSVYKERLIARLLSK